MKRVLLTSALVMGFVASANANVINGNQLYRPLAGQFASDTMLTTVVGGDSFKPWMIDTTLTYGITDRLSVTVGTEAWMFDMFDEMGWDMVSVGASFRALDNGNWQGDIFGGMTRVTMTDWYEMDNGLYFWELGTRIGYVTNDWTLGGFATLTYGEDRPLRWTSEDNGARAVTLGLFGQYIINSEWNIVGEFAYVAREFDNPSWLRSESLQMKLGVNYNISNDMFVGFYGMRTIEMKENMTNNLDQWTLGARLGVQF